MLRDNHILEIKRFVNFINNKRGLSISQGSFCYSFHNKKPKYSVYVLRKFLFEVQNKSMEARVVRGPNLKLFLKCH